MLGRRGWESDHMADVLWIKAGTCRILCDFRPGIDTTLCMISSHEVNNHHVVILLAFYVSRVLEYVLKPVEKIKLRHGLSS
jgi:hypothetical protein